MADPLAAAHQQPHDAPGDQNPSRESTTDTAWFKKCCKDVLAEKPGTPPKGSVAHAGMIVPCALGPEKVPAVFISQNNLWDGTLEIIRYSFLGGTQAQHTKVENAIVE